MHLVESLLHPRMIFALALFAVISVLVELLSYKVLLAVAEIKTSSWIMKYIIIPAARALALVTFILVSYPVLFGVESAPGISGLLTAGQLRLTNLVNVVFLLSLLLPLVPILNRWPALLLPIQGIAAASMVFQWWADTQPQVSVLFWPGIMPVASLFIFAFISHEAGKHLSHLLEQKIDAMLQYEGSDRLIYRAVIMVLQMPVILLYTLALGSQLA